MNDPEQTMLLFQTIMKESDVKKNTKDWHGYSDGFPSQLI
jgi:hypothetical protein